MKLHGRVAVVTGAARGIGLACARRLAEEGAKVLLSDIDAEGLDQAVRSLAADGFAVAGHVADVAERSAVDRLVDAAVETFDGLDIMLNNAGIAIPRAFMEVTEEDFDRVIAINLRGAFFGVQSAARVMIARGRGGVIINMSSINSRMANPSVATYAISKGGLNQVTGTAAVALAPHGIRVVGVGPGTIATEMLKTGFLTNAKEERMILSRTPAGRLGEASEVAAVVAFLASDDASYLIGHTIYPDGGRMILNYVMPEPDA